jgi:hypothetical protein
VGVKAIAASGTAVIAGPGRRGTALIAPNALTTAVVLHRRVVKTTNRLPTRAVSITTNSPRVVAAGVAVAPIRAFDSLQAPPPDPTVNPILPWKFPIVANLSPVGGRLQYFWRNWQTVGAEDWVLNVLRKGYSLHFNQRIQLSPIPIEFGENRDPMVREIKHGIIMEYLEKEAIEVAPTPLSPGFYASIFLRQKKSGKWRAIINLKPLNQHLVKQHVLLYLP